MNLDQHRIMQNLFPEARKKGKKSVRDVLMKAKGPSKEAIGARPKILDADYNACYLLDYS
jgi:hypothetical protein